MINEIRKVFDIKPKEKKQGFIEKVSTIQKQQKRINQLEIELISLKEQIKSEAYKKIIDRLDDPLVVVRLKKENKRLREKLKGIEK